MKKITLILLTFFLITGVLAHTDIAYIVKVTNDLQPNIITEIENLGLTYNVITENQIHSTNFSDYKILLLNSGNIQNAPVNQYNSLILNQFYSSSWAQTIGSSTLSSAYNLNHPITLNIPQNFNAYTFTQNTLKPKVYYLTGQKSQETSPITLKSNSGSGTDQYVIATKQEPRRAFFGIIESNYWTIESKRLFRNTLLWILEDTINRPPEQTTQIQDITWYKNQDLIDHINLYDYFSDSDDPTLNFEVKQNQNINIIINNGQVSFYPKQDWYGQEEVLFSASDSQSKIFSNKIKLNVKHGNRPPQFNFHSPTQNSIKILENQPKEFQVEYFDPDNKTEELDFYWSINSQKVSTNKTFLFNKPLGTYTLEAKVSDSEFDINLLWDIKVAQISDFSCTELSGDICTQDEYCPNAFLEVNDTTSCCPTKCLEKPPEFKKINNCSSLGIFPNQNLEISFAYSKMVGEYLPNEKIQADLNLINNLEKDYRFDLEFYLYDLERQLILETETKKIKIENKKSEYIDFEFLIPEKIIDGQHAIFVLAKNKDINVCNSQYILFELKRKQDDIRFEKIEPKTKEIYCDNLIQGEYIIKNWGSLEHNDVYVKIQNQELGINFESEKFDLREHTSSRNNYKGYFNIELPKNLSKQTYRLLISTHYDNQQTNEFIDLTIKECENTNRINIDNDIFLMSDNTQTLNNPQKTNTNILETKNENNTSSLFSLLIRIKEFIFWAFNVN